MQSCFQLVLYLQLQIQDNGRFICGASLFKPNYAISAAHCFDGLTANDLTVRAGTSYQGDDGTVVSVSRLIIHESFDIQQSYDYDIAILQLSEDFEMGPNIQTIGNLNFFVKKSSFYEKRNFS